jgi:hypothetical protein
MRISIYGLAAVALVQSFGTLCACGGSTGKSSGEPGEGGVSLSSGGGSTEAPTETCSSCSGCCDTTQTCQAGDTNTVCGTSGAACEDCAQAGGTCSAGQCVGTSSSFGAGTSSGGRPGGFPGYDGGFVFPFYDAGPFRTLDGGRPGGGQDGGGMAIDAGSVHADAGGSDSAPD